MPWWQRQTPLAVDTDIAVEKFHCTIDAYYRQTTWQVRLYHRIALLYRQQQEQEAEQDQRRQQQDQEQAQRVLNARQ